MKYLIFLLFLTGCTYSLNIIHTHGTASDLVDEDQKPSADIKLEVPIK